MSITEESAINHKPETVEGFETLNVFENEFGKVNIVADRKVMICTLLKEYVPIEEFKTIFNFMSGQAKKYGIEKFVFDKRHLRTFHQPSMEWYFIYWKKEMFELGLKTHRKILPEAAPWFNTAVEAGRAKIEKEHPNDLIIDQLDIQYKSSLKEAVES